MTYGSTDNMITITGEVRHETDYAILVDFGDPEAVWLPKSQLEDWPDVGDCDDVIMPEWLAKEKGVI